MLLADEKKWGKKRKKWRKKTKKKKSSEKKEASKPLKEYTEPKIKDDKSTTTNYDEDKGDEEHYDEEEGRVSYIKFYFLILVIILLFSCIKYIKNHRKENIKNINEEEKLNQT